MVDADGRAKAYRPLAAADRTAAVIAGMQAYDAGDFFEAHELMEPAWMGTDDPAERELIQGLIKLAAADVHGVRGNPRGVARNLEGARDRLRRVPDGDAVAGLAVRPPRGCSRPSIGASPSWPRTAPPTRSPSAGAADEPRSRDPDHRRHRSRASAARGPGRPDPARRPRGQRIRGGPGAGGGAHADVGVCGTGRGAAVGPAAHGRLPPRRAVRGGRRVPDPVGAHDVVNVAGGMDAWERAGLPVAHGAPAPGEGDLPG